MQKPCYTHKCQDKQLDRGAFCLKAAGRSHNLSIVGKAPSMCGLTSPAVCLGNGSAHGGHFAMNATLAQVSKSEYGIYAFLFMTSTGQKVYVGSTADSFHGRLRRHLGLLKNQKHPNPHLQNLWNTYQGFLFVVLEKCETKDELAVKEQSFIEAVPQEMLINYGPAIPSPRLGVSHTLETRKVLSEKTKAARAAGRGFLHHTPESRAKISSANKGKRPSEKTLRARAEKYNGKPLPPEWRKNKADAMKRPEVRAKISLASRGRIVSDETRAKMSIAQKARPPMSEEQRQNLSIWHTGKTHSPETRAKISAAKKGKKLHPLSQETKDKISKANKSAYARKRADKILEQEVT